MNSIRKTFKNITQRLLVLFQKQSKLIILRFACQFIYQVNYSIECSRIFSIRFIRIYQSKYFKNIPFYEKKKFQNKRMQNFLFIIKI